MDAQPAQPALPDFGKLTEAFSASSRAFNVASYEIGLAANLPAVNYGQQVLQAIERLSERLSERITTEVRTLRTEVRTLRTEVRTLRTEVQTLNGKIDSLDCRLAAESAYLSIFFELHHDNIVKFSKSNG